MICDEMGLGKSLQSLALSQIYSDSWPLLIISPSIYKEFWKEEVLKWILDICPDEIKIIRKGREQDLENGKVFIVSYKLANKLQTALNKKNFQISIVDECMHLKTQNASVNRVLIPFLTKMR